MRPTFSDDAIDTVRDYVEARLGPQIKRMHFVVKDHGACIGVLIETFDGRRHAVDAVADGNADEQCGAGIAEALERWIRAQ